MIISSALAIPIEASAQRRDFLTLKEVERLQEAQRIDLRIVVLTIAAERRFAALGLKQPTRRAERDWGETPTGTREELIRDIDRIILKAIDDIDYAATQETTSKFFRTGFATLKKSCEEYDGYFRRLLDETEVDRDKGVILSSLERCSQVVEAASQIN
jgi:acyl-CoA reductase-like NAD-dependent aldehyde dehydrogenase